MFPTFQRTIEKKKKEKENINVQGVNKRSTGNVELVRQHDLLESNLPRPGYFPLKVTVSAKQLREREKPRKRVRKQELIKRGIAFARATEYAGICREAIGKKKEKKISAE